ncbi:MAG: glycosyltransferase family 39 protein [Chloroflexi bacterium]|nr:glycosyltransferase family 39 protein [Chloroflexota bacterium]
MADKKKFTTEIQSNSLPMNRWVWIGLILLAFLLGLAVRFYDLTDLPLDFHPTRQFHSALIARGMYYENLSDVPDWQRDRAVSQWKAEGLIEPQVMQRLTAFTYQLIGAPELWAARLWAIFFWMLGGIFLVFLAKDLAGLPSAALAVVFYMLWPYAAIASRAFQPESLSVASLILALWLFYRWIKEPTMSKALAAGLACGIAIYIKLTVVFLLAPAVAGLVFTTFSLRSAVRNSQIWVVAGLAILPYLIYHIYGVYILGMLGEQYALRFFPNLWIDPAWYLRWINEMNHVVGLEVFLLAFGGGLILSKKSAFGMFLGLFIGTILYGFVFSYHVSTHDYYHLPLMLPVSLGLGLVFQTLLNAVQENHKALRNILVVIFILGFMVLKAWDVRVTLKRSDYRSEPAFWANLGEELGRDARVTGLMADYGYRLAYWGWLTVEPWLGTADINVRELAGAEIDLQGELERRLGENDYFVVTQFGEYNSQPLLKEYLEENYPLAIDRESVIVFDLLDKNPKGF